MSDPRVIEIIANLAQIQALHNDGLSNDKTREDVARLQGELLTATEEIERLQGVIKLLSIEETEGKALTSKLLSEKEGEIAVLTSELLSVRQETERLQSVINLLSNTDNGQASQDPPKHFEGWLVQRDPRGYFRLYKRVRGRMQGLYVGREWNEDKAMTAIKMSSE